MKNPPKIIPCFHSTHSRVPKGMWPWANLKYSHPVFFLQAVAFLGSLQEEATSVFLVLCHLYLWKEIRSLQWLTQNWLESLTIEFSCSCIPMKFPISGFCASSVFFCCQLSPVSMLMMSYFMSRFILSQTLFYFRHDYLLLGHHSVESWYHLSIWPE